MSALSVWFLLVMLPNLVCVVLPIVLVSVLGAVGSAIVIATAWEDSVSAESIEYYKSIDYWTRNDEIKQEKTTYLYSKGKKWLQVSIVSMLIGSIVLAAIPSREEVAAIVKEELKTTKDGE